MVKPAQEVEKRIDMNRVKNNFAPYYGVLLTITLCLATVFGLSCAGGTSPAQPGPEPSTPSSPATPEPSSGQTGQETGWQADGIITDGEYTGTQDYGDFKLWWTSDSQYIYIGMQANTGGWIAMALDAGQGMKDADMVLGFVQDGKTTVLDEYSTGNFGPHSADTELGGSDDILESGGKEEGGLTTLEFKRKLDTGDKYDRAFSPGKNTIIWAFGSDDQPGKKHAGRGHGEIDL
jgi:hypothetical protein